jgi:predicted transcriptional regulator
VLQISDKVQGERRLRVYRNARSTATAMAAGVSPHFPAPRTLVDSRRRLKMLKACYRAFRNPLRQQSTKKSGKLLSNI